LRFCASCYDAILTADIPEAIEALQKGDPKFAENGTNDAAVEATSCEDGFHGKSPLTNLNREVHGTSVVASAITRLLL
jgi:pectinesterase inhibitor-like protein